MTFLVVEYCVCDGFAPVPLELQLAETEKWARLSQLCRTIHTTDLVTRDHDYTGLELLAFKWLIAPLQLQ